MPAGFNCGPNSPLAWTVGCHCVRRGTAVIASQLSLPRLKSAAVQDYKWRYIKWASFTFYHTIIIIIIIVKYTQKFSIKLQFLLKRSVNHGVVYYGIPPAVMSFTPPEAGGGALLFHPRLGQGLG